MLGDHIRIGGKIFERRGDKYTWDGWWLRVRIVGEGIFEDKRGMWINLRKIYQGVETEIAVDLILKPREDYTRVVEYAIDRHGLGLAATVKDPSNILVSGEAPFAPDVRHRVATTTRDQAYWHFKAPPGNDVIFEIFSAKRGNQKGGGTHHQYVDADMGAGPGEDIKTWVEESRAKHVAALRLFQQTFPPQNLKRPR